MYVAFRQKRENCFFLLLTMVSSRSKTYIKKKIERNVEETGKLGLEMCAKS